VIPGAREAVARSRGHVGVIATESTVRSGAYERALHALEPEILVTSRACPLLVPLVEEGWLEEPITERIIERYLEPVLAAGIDTLVLGCTHYPLLTPLIARVAAGVTLVDSAQAVSAEVARDWPPAREMGSPATASLEVLVTDSEPRFAEIAERILGEPVSMTWVDVEPAATKATEEVLP
jgi:glutamate racemase